MARFVYFRQSHKKKRNTKSSFSNDFFNGGIHPYNILKETAEDEEWEDLDEDIFYFSQRRKFIPFSGKTKKLLILKPQRMNKSIY